MLEYNLPEELIAFDPTTNRGESRLLLIDRKSGVIKNKMYSDIHNYVKKGDLIVLNKTKVVKARFFGTVKRNNRDVEVLFIKDLQDGCWDALIGYSSHAKAGDTIVVGNGGEIEVLERSTIETNPGFIVKPITDDIDSFLTKYGNVPLPPYISRKSNESDLERYNTVFAEAGRSVAAPTASLNLTDEQIVKFEEKGAKVVYLELEIGWGTFAPLWSDDFSQIKLHAERISLDAETADQINTCKAEGGKVWAFGTTVVRTLESCTKEVDGKLSVMPINGETDIFIYPGYQFKTVDHLVTNFHAPNTSLLALVSAFMGEELIIAAYEQAVNEKYRFLSYGDSMLIL